MNIDFFSNVLSFVQVNSYFIIFLLMFIEGPTVTFFAAFLSSLGVFNIYLILLLSIVGNVLPDLIYFLIGRSGKRNSTNHYIHNFLNANKIHKIKEYLKNNPWKTITVIKLTPALPLPGFILAGTTELTLKEFFLCSFIISAIYSSFFVILGFYSGVMFGTISKYVQYSWILIGAIFLFVILVWILFRLFSSKISNRIEKI
jgi:membrane protein DedA with SNARE-associated domain